MHWTTSDFVLAGVFLALIAGTFLLAARRAGSSAVAIGVAVLGAAAAVLGELDDAPGLTLLGLLLVAGACAMRVRRARAS